MEHLKDLIPVIAGFILARFDNYKPCLVGSCKEKEYIPKEDCKLEKTVTTISGFKYSRIDHCNRCGYSKEIKKRPKK